MSGHSLSEFSRKLRGAAASPARESDSEPELAVLAELSLTPLVAENGAGVRTPSLISGVISRAERRSPVISFTSRAIFILARTASPGPKLEHADHRHAFFRA